MSTKTAMIFAAGLGTRLRPLTEKIPKPLVEVGGKPMLKHNIDMLIDGGIEEIIINGYYKFEMLEEYVSRLDVEADIKLIKEEERLETGGGVKSAFSGRYDEEVITLNSDIVFGYSDVNPVKKLISESEKDDFGTYLLIIKREESIGYYGSGDYCIDSDGNVIKKDYNDYIYTGLGITKLNLINNINKKVFSLSEVFDECLLNKNLKVVIHEDDWLHVGDYEGLDAANKYFENKTAVKI
jgi:MurNAc alpha-1-phosphate uridylyltransferase